MLIVISGAPLRRRRLTFIMGRVYFLLNFILFLFISLFPYLSVSV